MPRTSRSLAVVVAAGALGAAGAGVALADGRCGAQACKSDMSISGHAEPSPIKVNETARLKFTVKNNGPDGTESTDLQTTIPDGLQILGTKTYDGPQCSVSFQFVACKLGAFAAFQTMTVQVDVKAKKSGTFITPAKVYGYGSDDPNGGNGQVSVTLSTQGSGGAAGAGGTLKVADPQRPLKTGGVKVRVVTAYKGTMRVRGTVYAPKGRISLSKVVEGVQAGETKDVFLGTTTSALKRIREGLKGGRRLRVVISGSVGSHKMRTEIHVKR
ncbi:BatD family protein [Patulibacter minatonensis]|uniref:BatD family protein n=1 Tax=Patulibacter minatonensis TaxID=298163 RepID=UPI00047D0AB2|nr:DUF11 domain-containing protein [Patulibacter minatonensis]